MKKERKCKCDYNLISVGCPIHGFGKFTKKMFKLVEKTDFEKITKNGLLINPTPKD